MLLHVHVHCTTHILCIVGHTHLFPKYYVGAALFFIGLGEIIGKKKDSEIINDLLVFF